MVPGFFTLSGRPFHPAECTYRKGSIERRRRKGRHLTEGHLAVVAVLDGIPPEVALTNQLVKKAVRLQQDFRFRQELPKVPVRTGEQ